MENMQKVIERQKLYSFVEKIGQRINNIGAVRGASERQAMFVGEDLFKALRGNADAVTDQNIHDAFDRLGSVS